MARNRVYETNADRQRAYRQRHGINTIDSLYEWQHMNLDHKKDRTKRFAAEKEQRKQRRLNLPFVAFDGEGINTNIIQTYLKTDDDNNGMPIYRQNYVLLSASDGRYIENWKAGLSTKECLDFLLYYGECECINIGFGIGYDVTKMLIDLDEKQLYYLWSRGVIKWEGYVIRYTPNKIFSIYKDGVSFTWYDVRGFFQKSFIKALEDWKIEVPEEIREGKEQRATFSVKEKNKIRKYNLWECILLVDLMDKMRLSMASVDIVPYYWYGVGAMATVVLRDHGVKQHVGVSEEMTLKFLRAYFGGRNQVLKLGEFDKAYLHDINSAYPYAMTLLPSSIGTWYECEPEFYNHPWCLYELEWDIPEGNIITPFPVRCEGNIYYPLKGNGTYWQPEVEIAMKYFADYIWIKQTWCFYPDDSHLRPFAFYNDFYRQRQQFIVEGNDAQLVLKLALNAGYGKVAQSIGGKNRKPEFQNFFWAGMITSTTRAMVLQLAMQSPKDIIAFSTDGVASRKQLIEHSTVKQLGLWEVKQVNDYFILQTGIYTYKDADVEKFKSRGFGYKSVDYNELREEWRKHGVVGSHHYTENRFVGIGVGLQRNHPELIGCWYDVPRKIVFYPTTMSFDKKDRKGNYQLQPPNFVGESEIYQMKTNWLERKESFEAQDDADQIV